MTVSVIKQAVQPAPHPPEISTEEIVTENNSGPVIVQTVSAVSKLIENVRLLNPDTETSTRGVHRVYVGGSRDSYLRRNGYPSQGNSDMSQMFPFLYQKTRSGDTEYTYSVTFSTPQAIEFGFILLVSIALAYIWFSFGKLMFNYFYHILLVPQPPRPQVQRPYMTEEELKDQHELYANDVPPDYDSLPIEVLPPSPSSAPGSRPRRFVRTLTEEPPTFQEAVIRMIFRDRRKSLLALKTRRSASADSTVMQVKATGIVPVKERGRCDRRRKMFALSRSLDL